MSGQPESFEIDPRALDLELIRQPQMTRAAGHAEADARHAHAQAKARLDVTAARLRLDVRQNPEKYGLPDRPNVDTVEAAVVTAPDYQGALAELNQAKYDLDVLTADTVAMTDRRKCLERYIELLSLDYWAERGAPVPRTEGGRDRARDEVRRRTMSVEDGHEPSG